MRIEYLNTWKLLEILEEDACGSNDYDREMINRIKVELDNRNERISKIRGKALNEGEPPNKWMFDLVKSIKEIKYKQAEDFNRALVNTIKNK